MLRFSANSKMQIASTALFRGYFQWNSYKKGINIGYNLDVRDHPVYAI